MWNNPLHIAIDNSQIVIAQAAKNWPTKSTQIKTLDFDFSNHDLIWDAPIQALKSWLQTNPAKRRYPYIAKKVDVIVSSHFVQFACIPWSDAIERQSEWLALARIHFENLFGSVVDNWDIQIDMSTYGSAGIACAINRQFFHALRDLFRIHSLQLNSLQPYFIKVFNSHRHQISGDSVFVLVEKNQIILACCKKDRWHSMRTIKMSENQKNQLSIYINREILLQGLSESAAVHLHILELVNMKPFLCAN